MLYKTGLPDPEILHHQGLFRAPDPNEIVPRVENEDDRRGTVVDRAIEEMERSTRVRI